MKTINYKSTLFYYDGPQIFEARDNIGGNYIALMVDDSRYLAVGVAPEKLREFRNGSIDLRTLILSGVSGGWYIADTSAGFTSPIKLELQEGNLAETDFLPDDGFVLHDRPTEETALQEARSRNNIVMELSVEPPEAAEDHKIRLDTYVALLQLVKSLVKHAYGASLRKADPKLRREVDRTDASLLNVVAAAAPGSFRVVFEGVADPNLFGQSELSRAFKELDKVFEHVDNVDEAVAAIKDYQGHFAGAYLKLLQLLVKTDTGLHYSWAEPTSDRPVNHAISKGQAKPLADALAEISNLGTETVAVEGALDKIDVSKGIWRLKNPSGDSSGISDEHSPSLAGLITGKPYMFTCREENQSIEGTGTERRVLYLVSLKEGWSASAPESSDVPDGQKSE
jgi:hypothetical protein